jgi:hypothetical protein
MGIVWMVSGPNGLALLVYLFYVLFRGRSYELYHLAGRILSCASDRLVHSPAFSIGDCLNFYVEAVPSHRGVLMRCVLHIRCFYAVCVKPLLCFFVRPI